MTQGSESSNVERLLPLVAAVAFALATVGLHSPGSAGAIIGLALGYAAMIAGAILFTGVVLLTIKLVAAVRRGRPALPTALIAGWAKSVWAVDRGRSVWLPAATFVLVMTAFTFFKQTALPTAGFGSGPAIADVDRALFGIDPWRITHALMPWSWATQVIDLAYHAWFLPMTIGVALCAFARPGSVVATRYLLSYCLLWIVQGALLAYWLPAAGPAFFARFQVETQRFAELTHLLAEQDAHLRAAGAPGLMAVTIQQHLQSLFDTRSVALGGGISAMPSLHNAMAVLFACAARYHSRTAGHFLAAYAIAIWVGSVHLGWHYALDEMVALAVTVATWKVAGAVGQLARRRGGFAGCDSSPIAA